MRILCLGFAAISVVLFAQQSADTSGRELMNEVFRSSRARRTTDQPREVLIGVTLYRMRPSTMTDQVRDRGLGHHLRTQKKAKAANEEWSPVRIPLDTVLARGDWVRLSIESTRKGYMYVLDVDVSSRGAYGTPRLIFPTRSLRRGDNSIIPGFLLELPQWNDEPPAFEIESERGQSGIEVVLICSPIPLEGVAAVPEAQPVSLGFYQKWRDAGIKGMRRKDSAGQTGAAYTSAERDAATSVRQLAPHDPAPATVFQSISGSGEPAVAVFTLQVEE